MKAQWFCGSCGAPLPPNADFCSACGTKVLVEVVDEEPQSVGNPRHLRSLMFFIWLAIGVNLLVAIAGLFDVREYYSLGRFGGFLIAAGDFALSIWLAFCIAEGRNWARVTFVILAILSCLTGAIGTSGNKYVYYTALIPVVVNLVCAGIMCFEKSVSKCFRKDRKGMKHACAYWGVGIGFILFLGGYSLIYQSENEDAYFEDCLAAARAGSEDARSDLLDYLVENSDVEGSDEEIGQAAEEQFKVLCPERNTSKANTASKSFGWRNIRPRHFIILFWIVVGIGKLYEKWMKKK